MDFTGITQIDLVLIPLLSGTHCIFLDKLALSLTSMLTWLPFFLTLIVVIIRNNQTVGQIALVIGAVAFAFLLSDGMSDGIVKPLAQRVRPLNDPMVVPYLELVPGQTGKSFSFFSAHAANTMAVATFFSLLVRNSYLTVSLVGWSLINCWTRIYLCMHYPSDIAVGLVWGIISGLVAYCTYLFFYKKITPRLHFITSQYTSTGYAIGDAYFIINILILSVIVTMMKDMLLINN